MMTEKVSNLTYPTLKQNLTMLHKMNIAMNMQYILGAFKIISNKGA